MQGSASIGGHGLIALAAALTASAAVLHAEPARTASPAYVWENAVIGAGGYIPAIVFSPAERGLAYARTDMGGSYRWDAAAARWVPMQDGMAQSSLMGVESIAPDPRDANIVYLAAGIGADQEAAILRSHDRGLHWRVTPVPFRMGGNEPGRGLGERLAVDPSHPATLYFGSRHDGLWRSDDAGASWARVASFPRSGLGVPAAGATHGGISFVVIDPAGAAPGAPSRRIWAGVADPGGDHLFRSDDGGASWQAVAAAPPALLPLRAALAADGQLYVTYGDGIGPNDIHVGAVWRISAAGAASDITPPELGAGGLMGVAAGPPGTVAVGSVDRWGLGDTVWLSKDGGRHWADLGAGSRRDVTASPFLARTGTADFGHWISALAIDPADPAKLAYATGATVYAGPDHPGGTWKTWVEGIEQTAVVTLASPTEGAPVVSGLGDIAGFVHTDLRRSPAPSAAQPWHPTTITLDYAGRAPRLWVRSARGGDQASRAPTLAWSDDAAQSWHGLPVPAIRTPDQSAAQRYDLTGDAAAIISADGGTIVACIPVPLLTRDRGKSWAQARGLDLGVRPVADKVDPLRFYAVDFEANRIVASADGAASFAPVAGKGLPAELGGGRIWWREQPFRLVASPFAAGDLWFQIGSEVYRSVDGGGNWSKASGALRVDLYGLGKPERAGAPPTLFAAGTLGAVRGLWRSTDNGQSWLRINDDAHQWGLRLRVISGDPRRFGRVYLGTDGRGLLYGDQQGAGQ